MLVDNFSGTETAVFYGLEQWSRLYDMAVVYASIRREGPWKYTLTYELIADDVQSLKEGEILIVVWQGLNVKFPEILLVGCGLHKRWKHTRPANQVVHPRVAIEDLA